jgi:glycosyltransferase involved in cell wall biosynthesis
METNGGAEKVIETIITSSKHKNDALFCYSKNQIFKLKKSKIIGFNKTITISSSPFSLKLLINFSKLIKNYDIIHYHYPWPFMDILDLLFNKNKPVVISYHSDIVKQTFLKVIYYPIMLLFLNKSSKIICSSTNYLESSSVLQKFKDKCIVIPYGINIPKINYKKIINKNLNPIKNYFIFVGVLRYYKGLEILLQAVKINNINLLIIGSGPLKDKILRYIKNQKLSNVKIISHADDNLRNYYIKKSLGLILPSIYRSEAFGISLLEGAALGKPLISTDLNTGTTYINKNKITGIVVSPKNENELSQAMIQIKNDKKIQKYFGQNAQQRFTKLFNVDKMIHKYDKIYSKFK